MLRRFCGCFKVVRSVYVDFSVGVLKIFVNCLFKTVSLCVVVRYLFGVEVLGVGVCRGVGRDLHGLTC